MTHPLNRLILLGFICQGLSWDDYVLPAINVALWFICLQIRGRTKGLGQTGDILGMILGCALGYVLAEPFGASKHFFIGHGLTLLQASRLTRELDRRESIFSLVVALGQIGVACTVILDYRFILILFAALILIPKALADIERRRLPIPVGIAPPPIRLSWRAGFTLFIVLVLVFFGTPRGMMGNALRAPTVGGGASNVLDDMLDPTFGGRANSGQVLLQIDGEQVGYLRLFSLTLFDGRVWKREPAPQQYVVRGPAERMPTNLLHRAVRVKNATYLRRAIPYDGQLLALKGNFFRGPVINENGVITCRSIWNAANNSYEYWIPPEHRAEPLPARRRRLLLRHPPLTPAVRQWLDELTEGATNRLDAARRVGDHLLNNFEYELGAPNLNRLNALEQFLLEEKRGHCERFASALALLLRAKGIPTRVVVGFVPGRRNWLSGWYDVRFKDAHAWTEAWFAEHGWVQLDATPRASMTPSAFDVSELVSALDVIWFAHFVNFSAGDQQNFIALSVRAIRQAATLAGEHLTVVIPLLILLGVAFIWKRRRSTAAAAEPEPDPRRQQIEYAENCYGQMLRLLARHGLHKRPSQTPMEFLHALDAAPPELREPVRSLTQAFCQFRYAPSASIDPRTLDRHLASLRARTGRGTPGRRAENGD